MPMVRGRDLRGSAKTVLRLQHFAPLKIRPITVSAVIPRCQMVQQLRPFQAMTSFGCPGDHPRSTSKDRSEQRPFGGTSPSRIRPTVQSLLRVTFALPHRRPSVPPQSTPPSPRRCPRPNCRSPVCCAARRNHRASVCSLSVPALRLSRIVRAHWGD
jgi:hypothetical protein